LESQKSEKVKSQRDTVEKIRKIRGQKKIVKTLRKTEERRRHVHTFPTDLPRGDMITMLLMMDLQTNQYSIADLADYKMILLKVCSRDFKGAAWFQQKVNNNKINRCLTARICQDTHTSSVVFKTSASVLMGATGKRIF